MRLCGLVSISFRDLSPEALVSAVKAAGLTHIEWGSDVHAPAGDGERLSAIRALCEKEGIIVSSYGSYYRIGQEPCENIEPYCLSAKTLGTDIVRVWAGNKGSAAFSPAERDVFVRQCRRIAGIAEKYGVTLCTECHNNTFTDNADDALWLMQTVDHPRFQTYWQPNQFRTFEENCRCASLLAPYTRVVHVFNWEGKERFPLADGAEKWQAYLKQFDGSVPLLLEFMPDNRPEQLPNEAAALRRIAEGIE